MSDNNHIMLKMMVNNLNITTRWECLNLKTILVIAFACFFYSCLVLAQTTAPTPEQKAISALEFLTGNWTGPGISYNEASETTEYIDTELVSFELDRRLLLIKASGEIEGKPYYQLHTIVYYDIKEEHYVYTPYTGRRPGSYHCNLKAKMFVCLNQEKSYRLSFQRLEDGRWNEFGESLKEGKWLKSFETKLSRMP